MKKLTAMIAAATLPILSLAACSTSNQTVVPTGSISSKATNAGAGQTVMEPTKKSTPLRIAYVPVVMNTQYDMVLSGIKEEVDRSGGKNFAQIIVQAPSGNTSSLQEQPNILEGLIQQKIDAIALSTEDESAMMPYIKAASEKKIPIFLFNMAEVSAADTYYVTQVGYDQYEASKLIGEWAVKHFTGKETKIAVLEGFPGLLNTQRLNGFKDAIKGSSNLKIAASQSADWTRAKGQSVTENILTANPGIKFIYGMYDEMALGAVAAVKGTGHPGDIVVAGYDNTRDGYDSIKAGELQVTVDTGAKQMGVNLITAIRTFVVEGKPVERSIMVPPKVYDQSNIGTFDVKNYVYVPQQPTTKP